MIIAQKYRVRLTISRMLTNRAPLQSESLMKPWIISRASARILVADRCRLTISGVV